MFKKQMIVVHVPIFVYLACQVSTFGSRLCLVVCFPSCLGLNNAFACD